MISPPMIVAAMRRPFSDGVGALVHDALTEINGAAYWARWTPLTDAERAQIIANIKSVWPVWVEYKNANATVFLPVVNDQETEMLNLKAFIDTRDDTAAAILARVLDERLFLEIKRVRGGLARGSTTEYAGSI